MQGGYSFIKQETNSKHHRNSQQIYITWPNFEVSLALNKEVKRSDDLQSQESKPPLQTKFLYSANSL